MSSTSTSSACRKKLTTVKDDNELSFSVKCGSKTAEFYQCKLKRVEKSLLNCIKHCNNWNNLTEFEALAGLYQTKKWKQSIKCEGEPPGEWLADHNYDNGPDSSQECA